MDWKRSTTRRPRRLAPLTCEGVLLFVRWARVVYQLRTLRLSLAGTVIPVLLGGLGGAVAVRDDPMAPALVTGTATYLSKDSSGTLSFADPEFLAEQQHRAATAACRALISSHGPATPWCRPAGR